MQYCYFSAHTHTHTAAAVAPDTGNMQKTLHHVVKHVIMKSLITQLGADHHIDVEQRED